MGNGAVSHFQSLSLAERKGSIVKLEQAIAEMPQAEMPVSHYFADGLYGRRLHIPAGCVLTGAIHVREHINVLIKGTITVMTEEGPQTITAPFVMVSPPGTKRAGYAHNDCEWLTVHACEETTVEGAEKVLVHNDYQKWLEDTQCHLQSPEQS